MENAKMTTETISAIYPPRCPFCGEKMCRSGITIDRPTYNCGSGVGWLNLWFRSINCREKARLEKLEEGEHCA